MKQYRFKTEKEFIEDYGNNWKGKITWNMDGHMDYLYGTNVPIRLTRDGLNFVIENKRLRRKSTRQWWRIYPNMLTDKPSRQIHELW